MAEATAVRRNGRRARRTAVLATAAALAAAVSVGCSAPAGGAPVTDEGTRSVHDGARTVHAGQGRTGIVPVASLGPSAPDRITVPGIGVDAEVGSVGLDAQGVMETPPMDEPTQADWYRLGPAPGQKGAAVIVGHLDTPETEKAVFHDLKDLTKNEKIEIHRRDGATAVFAVDSVETFRKADFPTDKVYGGSGTSQLRLITCGGSLTANRHWDSNVVVFAHLLGRAGT
ncbi:class F sortase (plasmid) [Streptomyces sp. CA-294286]|uniref:class F sortase n=1 Tax=Streptomyces sp. CA-294286 TaxID=3240070 RepID=UPI003D93EA4C